MKKLRKREWNGFARLVRFLSWYGLALVALFYLLPIAGLIVESGYETLNSSARFLSVIGFFAVVTAWHVMNTRDRWRERA